MAGRRIRFADGVGGDEVVNVAANTPTPGGVPSSHKKAKTDQFSEWRRGNYNWVEAERQAEINAVVHPRPGAWDPWDLTDPAAESALEQLVISSRQRDRNRNADQAAPIAALLDEDPAAAAGGTAVTIALHERFQAVGFGRVTRLGGGGRNSTFRFGMEDIQGNAHNVVVKFDMTNGSATRNELAVMKVNSEISDDVYNEEGRHLLTIYYKRLSGARHVTQRLLLQAMPDPELDPNVPLPPRRIPTALGDAVRRLAGLAISPRQSFDRLRNRNQRAWSGSSTRARRIRRARRELDDAENVLIMEYLPKHDLGSWLERLDRENGVREANQRIRLPEKVLWAIFHCLWRGCIAMAWPGAQAAANNPGRQRSQIPLRTEYLPPGTGRNRRPTDPLVHFNLNPSSVLVGDFDDEDSHQIFPIIKISDFGLAKLPKWDVLGSLPGAEERYLWNLRFRGQIDSLLPEQTSEAWDFIPNIEALRASAIAGNYGSASNVFHIGLIMWQLVGNWVPEIPFVPRPYAVQILDREASGWTYGHALLDQYEDWTWEGRGVWPSETLRNTIAHCMDYMPRRRMNLTRLGSTIREMLDREWDQTDEEYKRWSEQLFADAPTQSTPTS